MPEASQLRAMPTRAARHFLLSISGIGAETADAILVYALDRPAFVVDAYARRLWQRLSGRMESDQDLRRQVLAACPDSKTLGELHALIVAHGKRHCRPKPLCEGCPLLGVCFTGRSP